MNINKLFVAVLGEKVYYFAKESDLNFYYNFLRPWEQKECKVFHVDTHDLDKVVLKAVKAKG